MLVFCSVGSGCEGFQHWSLHAGVCHASPVLLTRPAGRHADVQLAVELLCNKIMID